MLKCGCPGPPGIGDVSPREGSQARAGREAYGQARFCHIGVSFGARGRSMMEMGLLGRRLEAINIGAPWSQVPEG